MHYKCFNPENGIEKMPKRRLNLTVLFQRTKGVKNTVIGYLHWL